LSISDAAFALQPFTGSSHCGDQAEKWLEQFSRYIAFKKLNEDDQLQLFNLLMKDQAADWLTSLPPFSKDDIHVLKDEFMKRRQMTRVEKWKQTADIWRRRQGPTEPVDDYIAAMQAAARRVKMSLSSLADAIIKGCIRKYVYTSYTQVRKHWRKFWRRREYPKQLIPQILVNQHLLIN
jgi:hypothetical protein